MARLTHARKVELARQKAENRARRLEFEATHTPRDLDVDDATIERRDQFAAQLLSYYEFLITLYLPADCLKRPPEGGWPNITAERMSFLGKTDAVVDLLKHIPYIRGGCYGYLVFDDSYCFDYSGDEFESRVDSGLNSTSAEPYDDGIDDISWDRLKEPQHLATIVARSEKYGSNLIVGTRDGQLANIGFVEGWFYTEDSPQVFFADR